MADNEIPLGTGDVAQATEFLETAAKYFEGRPTHGEDSAHWANFFNAKNCRTIAALLIRLQREKEGKHV